jgi:hypothetical protein
MRRKETRGIETMLRRGEDNPCETRWNSDRGGTRGGDVGIQNLFIVQNIIYLVLRLPLNLLKCMYSHCIVPHKPGITLSIIKGGSFVQNRPSSWSSFAPSSPSSSSASPRDRSFQAASLLSRMISADGGRRGERMRRSVEPSQSPPLATKLRFHRPSVLRLTRPV